MAEDVVSAQGAGANDRLIARRREAKSRNMK
jgi:hypothetical protein